MPFNPQLYLRVKLFVPYTFIIAKLGFQETESEQCLLPIVYPHSSLIQGFSNAQVTGKSRVSRLPVGGTELVFLQQEPHCYLGGLQPDRGGPQCTGKRLFRHLQGGRDGHWWGVDPMEKGKKWKYLIALWLIWLSLVFGVDSEAKHPWQCDGVGEEEGPWRLPPHELGTSTKHRHWVWLGHRQVPGQSPAEPQPAPVEGEWKILRPKSHCRYVVVTTASNQKQVTCHVVVLQHDM